MSIRPTTKRWSLNVDFSIEASTTNINVVEYLRENQQMHCQPNKALNQNEWMVAISVINGLNVAINHSAQSKKIHCEETG